MNKRKMIIMTIIFMIDQFSKYLISVYDVHYSLINNFLNINYTLNDGISFSMLSGKRYIIITLSIILLVLVYSLIFSFKKSKFNDYAFGILLGGILGNLVDRIFFFGVRDFIDVNILNFPIFNIADMSIIIGVILIVILSFKEGSKNGNKSK